MFANHACTTQHGIDEYANYQAVEIIPYSLIMRFLAFYTGMLKRGTIYHVARQVKWLR